MMLERSAGQLPSHHDCGSLGFHHSFFPSEASFRLQPEKDSLGSVSEKPSGLLHLVARASTWRPLATLLYLMNGR